jgi:hypothetical protein
MGGVERAVKMLLSDGAGSQARAGCSRNFAVNTAWLMARSSVEPA